MRALCQLLLEQQQVLLASSHHDLLRRIRLPLQQWYMLQPAADGSGLLLRWVASREQLLPPKRRDSSALGSSVGGSAAAACLENEVVLLDAEQLEAVRDSLASLQGFGGSSRGAGSGGCTGEAAQSTEEGGIGLCEGEDGGQSAAEELDALMVEAGEGEAQGQQQLLLSCGLDDWLAAVLGASSATYTPPVVAPAAPTAAFAAGQRLQQGPSAAAAGPASLAAAAAPQQLVQHPHQPHPPVHVHVHGVGQTGQHAGQHGGMGPAGGLAVPGGGNAAHPGELPDCQDHTKQQQQQQHNQQMQQQPGYAEGGAGGKAVGGGRGGGRGRRNSSSGAANGRKLRLSKV